MICVGILILQIQRSVNKSTQLASTSWHTWVVTTADKYGLLDIDVMYEFGVVVAKLSDELLVTAATDLESVFFQSISFRTDMFSSR